MDIGADPQMSLVRSLYEEQYVTLDLLGWNMVMMDISTDPDEPKGLILPVLRDSSLYQALLF